MQRESYGDRFETKGEEQQRLAEKAHGRLQSDAPVVTPQSAVISESASASSVTDGTLSWASGDHRIAPGGPPFTPTLVTAAGVGGPGLQRLSPSAPSSNVRSVPLATSSNTGKHMNGCDIFGDGK